MHFIDENVNAFVDNTGLLSYSYSVRFGWHDHNIALEIVFGLTTTFWGPNNSSISPSSMALATVSKASA